MESAIYVALTPFFLIPAIIFVFAIVEVVAKYKAAKILRYFEIAAESTEAMMDYPKKEAKRLVKMIYRMYAPRGTRTHESMAITNFLCLTKELEASIRARAIGQRDRIVLELVSLFQQHAG